MIDLNYIKDVKDRIEADGPIPFGIAASPDAYEKLLSASQISSDGPSIFGMPVRMDRRVSAGHYYVMDRKMWDLFFSVT